MRAYIFTDRERRILEAFATGGKLDNTEASKILDKIRRHQTLFEDVYLYLRIRKTMTT